MTGVAFDVLVFPKQGKFGFPVMIEWNFLPAALDVAGFALRTELAFVLIIFFVARETVCLQFLLVQIPFMATHALRFTMFS